MDLLDKKLSEKLKLFEYIDKKYGTNIEESNTKKRETASNTGSKDFFQKENDIKLNNELYDNIYSDFKTNSYKSYFYSPSVNTIDSNITKHYSKLNNYKYSKKNSYNYKNHNLSRDRNLTHENRETTNRSKSNTNTNTKKNISKLQPPNDSGNRLYNYGYYIKNKLNKKRKLEEQKAKKQMIPKILNRSKEIKRDSNFEERLYYAEKNDTNDNIYNRRRTLSRDNINYQKKNKSIFTYHPKINKKSLLIASKLEPSTLRINRKKVNYSNYVEDKTVIDYYSNLFKDKNNINYRKNKSNNNISPTCGNEKSNELYIKGLQDLKRKEQTYNENLQKKEEEYKKYTFKPKITKHYSSSGSGMKIGTKKGMNKEDIYKKNKEWKKRVENENITKKKKYDEMENKKYTFKPEINQLNIQNDVPFIMKNIQQMNEYVNKRRKILEQKKEEENYKKRKLGLNAVNYNVKTTIPKEFDLKTEKRNKSNKKERDLNIIKKKEKNNEKINNQAIMMANNIKVKNNNKGLSYLNRDILNEDCKENFFNKGTNFNCSITQSQQEFINAVNDLHNTIDKLNI
jgi:hypothetical protein